MQKLTIRAVSLESGRAMFDALREFRPELVEAADGCEVNVSLRGDQEIVAVLNALERYITSRAAGPARVEFDGRSYVMHPDPGT